jgi:hypothetical protein
MTTLAALRRRTGLPHRIVIDQAHYFLHDPSARALLDLDLGGYALITYRMSDVHPDILAACETIITTRVTDSRELQALIGRQVGSVQVGSVAEPVLVDQLSRLSVGEAVLLPSHLDDDTMLRPFRLLPRLSPHVRHRHKYLDVPVPAQFAFVFNGWPPRRIRTFSELCSALRDCPPEPFEAHLVRGDFSRWIGDVFGDYPLAARLREIEARHRRGDLLDARDHVLELVEQRYVLADDVGLSPKPDSARCS